MIQDRFIDPYTKHALERDAEGTLACRCGTCKTVYRSHEGCYDFVVADAPLAMERQYYDHAYSEAGTRKLSQEMLKCAWLEETTPWRKTFLDSLGPLAGKRILLLGNGDSYREFYFLELGATVVFTDLSIEAVKRKKREFESSEFFEMGRGRIEFHALDATHLPFPDGSFDVIYGSAIVHHLGDLDQFFSEIHRCLRVDGICRFLDEAKSPLWDLMKRTVLYPLKLYSHWRDPRSPADLEAEARGGYTKDAMASLMERHGFRELVFIREWFFFRIVYRHYGKLVRWKQGAMRRARPLFLSMKWLDRTLARTKWMADNQLMLIWGFKR